MMDSKILTRPALIKMTQKTNAKLNLTTGEKQQLRTQRIRISELLNFSGDELEVVLKATPERAREIVATAVFQSIPSIGIRFAQDLIFLGFYEIEALEGKDPAQLTDEYEFKKGYRTDPCVEDQFRLAVFYANTNDNTKKWWDFTEERKKYRKENGYPASRPALAWHEAPA
jgi:hypothetical protein